MMMVKEEDERQLESHSAGVRVLLLSMTLHSASIKRRGWVWSVTTVTGIMSWIHISCLLLTCRLGITHGKASEYQLESDSLSQCESLRGVAVAKQQTNIPHCTADGQFRGQQCWCVDAKGQEIVGTRTSDSLPKCPSPCVLLRQQVLGGLQVGVAPRCQESGDFQAVQCDGRRGQCWCVDQQGMELYGTRQNGRPARCPGSCEVRARRLLHATGGRSPPQCSDEGSFLPVQCQFINTTDRTEMDLLDTYNRFPEVFASFSSFRKAFPLVSSYCYCSDSQGREMDNTGVELLLSEVYDTVFSDLRAAHSFSRSNMYRILQRRLLAARLALTGSFRCPTPCEVERRAAQGSSGAFVPSCQGDGSFSPMQCQLGELCWCVDPRGREVPGTQQPGDTLTCGSGQLDCPSQRRLALSRLLSSGPLDPPGPLSDRTPGSPRGPCSALLQPLMPLLQDEGAGEPVSFLTQLGEVLVGVFPSVGGALEALARSSPGRLQENLFGGKFLKNAAVFNFSGAVGERGSFQNLDQRLDLGQSALNQKLVRLVSRALEDPGLPVLVPVVRSCSSEPHSEVQIPRCTPSGLYQQLQCHSAECWCVTPQGAEVAGSRTATGAGPPRCPSRCERERALALTARSLLAAAARVYVPACSGDGSFLPLQCDGERCFCVDHQGAETPSLAAGGDVSCPATADLSENSPVTPGSCSVALRAVAAFQTETDRIISLSNASHLPLGEGFLLAQGIHLTPEELHVSQSADQLQVSEQLLSRSRAALRLAAYSTVQMYWRPQRSALLRLSYQPYTPQCDAHGLWLPTQCHPSTGQCWCVDEDGEYIPASLTSHPLKMPECPSRCQRAQVRTLLSGWMKGSDIMVSYQPQCEEKHLDIQVVLQLMFLCDGCVSQDGGFSVLQTGGAGGWCVSPLTGEVVRPADLSPAGQPTCPSWCELQGLQCQPDGSFVPLQCDITSCWCVSDNGQEVTGSRTPRSISSIPSCDRPRCSDSSITHGALLCRTAAGRQNCSLACHHGYQNALAASSFLCDVQSQRWEGETPLAGACQRSQVFQTLQTTADWSLPLSEETTCLSLLPRLEADLTANMATRGLCSLLLPVSGRSVSVCDDASFRLHCESDDIMSLNVKWMAMLSDIPTSDLPDLHDLDHFLRNPRLVDGVQGILGNYPSLGTSELVARTTPSFGCASGFHPDTEGTGCVMCPAGSSSSKGACLLCPEGTYQEEDGRDFCNKCPRGSSAIGASSVRQCEANATMFAWPGRTECQRQGLRCSEDGSFLPAQPDFLSGTWRCVTSQGAELVWTNSKTPLTDGECRELSRFEVVAPSSVATGEEESEVLLTQTADLRTCVQACAAESSCHHVALFTENGETHCQLYSTHTVNALCNTTTRARGFLGNPEVEWVSKVTCVLRVRGGAKDLLVVRKKGQDFSSRLQKSFERMRMRKALSGVVRTVAFSSAETTLTDAHRYCQDQCAQDPCCDGFILNRNVLEGGSILCGLMRTPSVLQCADQDWDVIGQGMANRVCGAGLTYSKQQRSLVFNFGGQEFTITDSALPADSKNKTDYQASIISFQAIYLQTGSEVAAVDRSSCKTREQLPLVDVSEESRFEPLPEDGVVVDPSKSPPGLSYWLNKEDYNSQQALLWCLKRCDEEEQCSLVDVRQDDSDIFHSCLLFPDSTVCGAYDKKLRQPCRPLLARRPNNAYKKKVDLSGPVKSFYSRVSFQKMVSYSVRSRVSLGDTPLSAGFLKCERRCDEDPCCRGIGFVRDSKSPAGSEVVCLSLVSLGVQTCSEERGQGSWTVQDCRPSAVETTPYPLGWYQKPVNQWSRSPALCPPFSLPSAQNVSLDRWNVLDESAILVDPSLSSYDVVHISQDIAGDMDKTRDWCLHACQGAESCVALSISQTESATRCVLYPDTRACGLSSSPSSSSPASSCRLVLREPASLVYLKKERLPSVTSVLIPGHGTLRGVTVETTLGSDRKSVVRYLGVPYARPPIGPLRFRAPEPAVWTGSWDATKPRAGCLQPGDEDSPASSEDCLYLNIFTPTGLTGPVPVLVFFFNPSANQSPGLLDGSTLAAVGNIVVVTASFRTAALGFLSTGHSGLRGNYGMLDQAAVLRWVDAHIFLVGGDNRRVTVGAERRGADITSLHLLSSSSSPPLFQRMMLMGGSVFSPAALQSSSVARRQAVELASQLGCMTSDPSSPSEEDKMAACLRQTPVHALNAAQTKLLAASGPFQAWSPVSDGVLLSIRQPISRSYSHRVPLLIGTSAEDGLISRAAKIKDFEALQGRADSKTAFYEALTRSLGGERSRPLVKQAASWFYSLQHSASPAGYNLLSRALNNATRDQFIVCPVQQMASHWASNKANVFLYHLPENSVHHSADRAVPLDVQFAFGTPHHPINSQRFGSSGRRLSLAVMTYVANFIKTGDPNRAQSGSRRVPGAGLPQWGPVLPSPASPQYKELDPSLQQQQGLHQAECSFWTELVPELNGETAELGAESVQATLTPDLFVTLPSSQSQTKKDGYN
ncbi:Thyroglobulin [Merluccius polli]|uniref:Thyroglobulin n=1 Tax=Merluccius polli TaxID=89951 RepID=A0AA47MYX0_MERPO|nr:Thyroglobulin [Merluccius polli]